MPKSKKSTTQHQPHGRRDQDSADDRPQKRRSSAGAVSGEQNVNAAAEAADRFEPDRDGTGW